MGGPKARTMPFRHAGRWPRSCFCRPFPRQPACDVRDAAAIVKDLHAFFTFLARTGECPRAADCALVFDADSDALQPVLAALTAVGVHALTVTPPSLEELFLRHYGRAA